jgi:hypothetical protein
MPHLGLHEVQEDIKHGVQVGNEPESKADTLDVVTQGRLAPVQYLLHVFLLLPANEDQEQNVPVLVIQERQDGLESPNLLHRKELRYASFFTRL